MKLLIMLLLLVSCGKQTIIKEYKSADGLTSLITTSSTSQCDGIEINVGVDHNQNNILDFDEITNTEVICNGKNGIDGKDGINGANGIDGHSSIISIFNICGDDKDLYGEILLILNTGEMIGVMNDEYGSRLIIIPQGVLFQSSDKNKCLFTL